MARARLLGHVERLRILPIDRANLQVDPLSDTLYDNVTRKTAIILSAQLETDRENQRVPAQGGARIPVTATAIFLRRDVDRAGWHPADGDLVNEVSPTAGSTLARAVNWYVTSPQDTGKTHYETELIKVTLVDRPPSRKASEGLEQT